MENPAVIFDNGSGFFKAGLGDDYTPRVVFPTIVGKPEKPNLMVGMDQKDLYLGAEAYEKRKLLNLTHPIERGEIKDIESMKKIWQHTYENELVVDAKENPVMLTEPPKNDKRQREELIKIFFEEFEVEKFYLAIQSVLALYATGTTTGLVVDIGAGVTHTVPVYEGFALPFATNRMDLAGDDLTKYLQMLLETQCHVSNKIFTIEEAERLKCEKCFVALDIDTAAKESDDKDKAIEWVLPDGNTVKLTSQQFSCPEALFQPSSCGLDHDGIHDKTYQSITKCENSIRKDLYKNIVLTGGSTMFEGLGARLKKEVSALAPSTMDITVMKPLERKHSVWIGGSILSTITSFNSIWVTRKEYNEQGVEIVHKKCF